MNERKKKKKDLHNAIIHKRQYVFLADWNEGQEGGRTVATGGGYVGQRMARQLSQCLRKHEAAHSEWTSEKDIDFQPPPYYLILPLLWPPLLAPGPTAGRVHA
jgi:hypothetical protein